MSQTDILQISTDDVMIQLNGLQEIGLPLIGGAYGASDSVVLSYAKRAEAVTLSTIPEMYRVMTREIAGEIVVEAAYDGQTTFVLGLTPVVEGSLALYVDFGRSASEGAGLQTGGTYSSLPSVNRVVVSDVGGYGSAGSTPYSFRTIYDRLPTDKFSLDKDAGVVTLINGYTLRGGSKVYADYKHTAMGKCENLKDIAIRLAASNFGTSLAGITDGAREFLMQMQRQALEQLYAIMRGEAGVDMLDQVKLVDETRQVGKIPRRGFSVFM